MSRPSVVVQIAGGLGNQLFQYAFGRALSLRNRVPLVLDRISRFRRDFYRRQFTLGRYHIHYDVLPRATDYSTIRGRVRRRLARWLNSRLPTQRRTYIQEPDAFAYDDTIARLPVTRRTYFEGGWQHEEYFRPCRDLLLRDLALISPVSEATNVVADRMASSNAVCLHVRRLHGVPNKADAQPLAHNSEIHLDLSYYDRAIAFVAQRVPQPHFFIFADYPDWAREHLHVPFLAEYVTHNGPDRDYEDLWLMSRCRFFIIANSTFSWWGAWLAQHTGKLVVAPESGIGCGLKSIPTDWIRL
jgi:hypothetical protein